MRNGHRGFTLTELTVTLLILALVAQGAWSVFVTFQRAALGVASRAEALETIRTVGWILSEELGGGEEGVDWMGLGDDTVVVRAYRGIALPEEWGIGSEVVVCFRGSRNPNLAKDSLLVLTEDGDWRAISLLGRSPSETGCWDGEEGRRELWEVGGADGGPWLLARLFESGSYHFQGGALRYRQPGGGRQPLTPGIIREGSFHRIPEPSAGLGWEVGLESDRGGGFRMVWAGRVR